VDVGGIADDHRRDVEIMEASRGWVNQRRELPGVRRYNLQGIPQSRTLRDEAGEGRGSRPPFRAVSGGVPFRLFLSTT